MRSSLSASDGSPCRCTRRAHVGLHQVRLTDFTMLPDQHLVPSRDGRYAITGSPAGHAPAKTQPCRRAATACPAVTADKNPEARLLCGRSRQPPRGLVASACGVVGRVVPRREVDAGRERCFRVRCAPGRPFAGTTRCSSTPPNDHRTLSRIHNTAISRPDCPPTLRLVVTRGQGLSPGLRSRKHDARNVVAFALTGCGCRQWLK
jgi:hypothetical protein